MLLKTSWKTLSGALGLAEMMIWFWRLCTVKFIGLRTSTLSSLVIPVKITTAEESETSS